MGAMSDKQDGQSAPSVPVQEPLRQRAGRALGAEGRYFSLGFVPVRGSGGGGEGGKLRPELAGPPAGRLPASPAALTFLRGILGGGGGSEAGWSPAPPAREAAVAAVLALAGSVVAAVSPVLRHVCSGGASPLPPARSRRRQPLFPARSLTLPPGHGPHPPSRDPEPASRQRGLPSWIRTGIPAAPLTVKLPAAILGSGRGLLAGAATAAILGPGVKSAGSRRHPGSGAGVFPREPCWVRAAGALPLGPSWGRAEGRRRAHGAIGRRRAVSPRCS